MGSCLKRKENQARLREVENNCEFSVSRLWEADDTTCRPRYMEKGAGLGERKSSRLPKMDFKYLQGTHCSWGQEVWRNLLYNVFPYHFITLEDFGIYHPLLLFFHYFFKLGYSECQAISAGSWLDSLQSPLRAANLELGFQQIPSWVICTWVWEMLP